jgi:hypothetical protein
LEKQNMLVKTSQPIALQLAVPCANTLPSVWLNTAMPLPETARFACGNAGFFNKG